MLFMYNLITSNLTLYYMIYDLIRQKKQTYSNKGEFFYVNAV